MQSIQSISDKYDEQAKRNDELEATVVRVETENNALKENVLG